MKVLNQNECNAVSAASSQPIPLIQIKPWIGFVDGNWVDGIGIWVGDGGRFGPDFFIAD